MWEQNKRHVHHAVIVAWAEGKPIQRYNILLNQWRDWSHDVSPGFSPEGQYRIKPEPRTPAQIYVDAGWPYTAPNKPDVYVSSGFEAGIAAVINAVKSGELK